MRSTTDRSRSRCRRRSPDPRIDRVEFRQRSTWRERVWGRRCKAARTQRVREKDGAWHQRLSLKIRMAPASAAELVYWLWIIARTCESCVDGGGYRVAASVN